MCRVSGLRGLRRRFRVFGVSGVNDLGFEGLGFSLAIWGLSQFHSFGGHLPISSFGKRSLQLREVGRKEDGEPTRLQISFVLSANLRVQGSGPFYPKP